MAVFSIRSGLEVHRTAPSMLAHAHEGHARRELNDIAVNPLTTLLVDAGDDGACHVYDMERWTSRQTLQVGTRSPCSHAVCRQLLRMWLAPARHKRSPYPQTLSKARTLRHEGLGGPMVS